MSSSWLWYLAAATGCQAAFALLYWLVLAQLSTFGWNRAYLLGSLAGSVLLPLVALPAAWAQFSWPATLAPVSWGPPAWQLGPAAPAAPAGASSAIAFSWQQLLLAGYWLGVAWQAGRTLRGLGWLYRLSRRHPRTRLGRGWLVQLPAPSRPAFSFGNYVFLSPEHARLSSAEHAQLLAHEQVHGAQLHSLDLLLAELIGWFFWFNGLVYYLRRELRTVHEYLADAAVARQASRRVAYCHLLLKLAARPLPSSLVHPFAAKQVARRIHMLTHSPSSSMKKLRFLLVLPVAALAWVGAAALGPVPTATAGTPGTTAPSKTQGRIGKISWQGNTFLTAAELSQALGLKPGDPYSKELLDAKLNNPADGSITSRYMNQGYLFFSIDPLAKTQPDGSTDLTFRLMEGRQAKIGTILVQGNQQVPTAEVLALLPLRSGELFSRAKLIASQQALFKSNKFKKDDPLTKAFEGIQINPQPVPRPAEATDLVNIEFVVTER